MDYKFIPITLEYAKQIRDWRYDGFMEQIYMKPYFDNYKSTKQLIGPDNCIGFVAMLNDEIFGIFEYYHPESELEIGLAINPKFTGKGNAKDYVLQGVNFGVEFLKYKKESVKLLVNKENKPAYKAYLNAGFKEVKLVDGEVLMRLYL